MDFSILPGTLKSPADGIIYVTSDATGQTCAHVQLQTAIKQALELDEGFSKNVTIISLNLPCRRLIFSPVPNLTDYDDEKSFSEAAARGVKRALQAGLKKPLLILPKSSDEFPSADLVTLLGALEALYVPIQLREDVPLKGKKIEELFVASEDDKDVKKLVDLAVKLESGRIIARDIGGGDPERMAPPRVEKYVREVFKKYPFIKIEVEDRVEVLEKEYPLFAAVNRAASVIERHRGRVIYLRYEGAKATKTVYLVGKGITYDTGGADLKTNGVMAGMSRDKCGAAAVAGFFKVLAEFQPKGLRFVGALCLARNSIGENAYVADEVVTARSGARVRIQNTDAEGRMVMADVLCKLKEEALQQTNVHLFTIATLTGHAVLAVGPYTILLDNSVARKEKHYERVQSRAAVLGDPIEVSVIRKQDLAFADGRWEGDDCHQSNNQPSSRTSRGHQGPAGFLLKASGLDKHGLKSEKPLKYTHLDIAGSAGDPPAEPTGSPIIALYAAYLQD